MDDMAILPNYKGYLVHDCYAAYFKEKYGFRHVLCNAHLLRDCAEIAQFDHHRWATEMTMLLQKLEISKRSPGEKPVSSKVSH